MAIGKLQTKKPLQQNSKIKQANLKTETKNIKAEASIKTNIFAKFTTNKKTAISDKSTALEKSLSDGNSPNNVAEQSILTAQEKSAAKEVGTIAETCGAELSSVQNNSGLSKEIFTSAKVLILEADNLSKSGENTKAKEKYQQALAVLAEAKIQAENEKNEVLQKEIEEKIEYCNKQINLCENKTGKCNGGSGCKGGQPLEKTNGADKTSKPTSANQPQNQQEIQTPQTKESKAADGLNNLKALEGLKNTKEAEALGLKSESDKAKEEYSKLSQEYNSEKAFAAQSQANAASAKNEVLQAEKELMSYQGKDKKLVAQIASTIKNLNNNKQISNKENSIIEAQTKLKDEYKTKQSDEENKIKETDNKLSAEQTNLDNAIKDKTAAEAELAKLDTTDPNYAAKKAEINAKIQSAQTKIDECKKRIAELKKEKLMHEAEAKAYAQRVKEAETKIENSKKSKAEADKNVQTYSSELEKLNSEKQNLTQKGKELSEKIQTANEKYTNALSEQYEHLAKAQAAYDKTETVQTILDNKIDAIKNN